MASKLVELILSADAQALIGATNQSRAAVKKLDGEFRTLENSVKGALSFVGIGLGASEIIKLADSYGQMTGKLKLATQYSGDYAETQQLLRDSARSTRSELGGTVQLYTTLIPALKGIGLGAKESVGLITTINQAIGLSGASAEAAEAALVQLGQGFAGGALRGQELNSVMEQTPALAQAIADGLGVPRGALKQMGEEGKLTADVVAKALQKVADQVNDDFSRMPVTVGQALTNLKNEFMVFVGATDQAAGGTSTLAGAINSIANEFTNAGPAVTAFTFTIKTLMAGLDGSYRLLQILGLGIAAYAAAIKESLFGDLGAAFEKLAKGDIKGAISTALAGDANRSKKILEELGNDIQGILEKPLIANPFEHADVAAQKAINTARKRKQLEEQLADQVKKLEQLKAYEAGKASDNVAAKEKSNIDARIADQKRLVDAVRAAWQDSLAEVEKATEAAQKKLTKAADIRSAGDKTKFELGIAGLPEEDQLAAKQARFYKLQGDAESAARAARIAALKGDAKSFDAAADVAEKKLSAALDMAKELKDIFAVDALTDLLAGIQEAGAAMDQQRAAAQKEQAASQAAVLADLQKQLDDMTSKARTIEVQADVSRATLAIAGLKAQLAEIPDNTVKTVTVQTITSRANPAVAQAIVDNGGSLPVFAGGGRIRGPGTGTSDSILARLSDGEYVVRSAAVSHYGAHLLNRINSMQLPKFAEGGVVGRSASNSATPLVLDFGKLGRFDASAPADTAEAIERVFVRAALARGRR